MLYAQLKNIHVNAEMLTESCEKKGLQSLFNFSYQKTPAAGKTLVNIISIFSIKEIWSLA